MIYIGRGSTALWAILNTLENPGGKVMVPANICEMVVAVILKAGWRPVFYDVDPRSGNAEVRHLEAAFTDDIACAIAVSNFGTPVPMEEISAWARAKKIFLIEDACNALGAVHQDRAIGSWGDAAMFSFDYAKIIEHRVGGALTVRDDRLRAKAEAMIASMPLYTSHHEEANRAFQMQLRELRHHPDRQNPDVYLPLYDRYADHLWYRIDDGDIRKIEENISRLPENLLRRREIAAIYSSGIRHPAITFRPRTDGDVFWRFTFMVRSELRGKLLATLRAENILVSAWYPPVQHLFQRGARETDFCGAYEFGTTVVNLFTDHHVDHASAEKTVALINRFT